MSPSHSNTPADPQHPLNPLAQHPTNEQRNNGRASRASPPRRPKSQPRRAHAERHHHSGLRVPACQLRGYAARHAVYQHPQRRRRRARERQLRAGDVDLCHPDRSAARRHGRELGGVGAEDEEGGAEGGQGGGRGVGGAGRLRSEAACVRWMRLPRVSRGKAWLWSQGGF
jgi:hypothetical protein